MSEILKLLWAKESSAMESCYKLYSWINHTVLMLLLQIFWKVAQISDYFKENAIDETQPVRSLSPLSPLTMQHKFKRHIRSMSDVQSSTPYRALYRYRKGSHPTLAYDSDTRARRIRQYRLELESSDSSDYQARKPSILEQRIMKHSDSMRIL